VGNTAVGVVRKGCGQTKVVGMGFVVGRCKKCEFGGSIVGLWQGLCAVGSILREQNLVVGSGYVAMVQKVKDFVWCKLWNCVSCKLWNFVWCKVGNFGIGKVV
jgi:hypothetical protein